jgi:hypothetical protein
MLCAVATAATATTAVEAPQSSQNRASEASRTIVPDPPLNKTTAVATARVEVS